MPKINPAVRMGLIWAGVHQACVLLAWGAFLLPSYWAAFPGAIIAVADIPALLIADVLGVLRYIWHSAFEIWFSKYLPPYVGKVVNSVIVVLTLGALQWFLIGYAVAVRRSKSKARKQAL